MRLIMGGATSARSVVIVNDMAPTLHVLSRAMRDLDLSPVAKFLSRESTGKLCYKENLFSGRRIINYAIIILL